MTTTRKRLQEAVLSERRSRIGDAYLRADAWFFGQQHAVNYVAPVGSGYNSLGTVIELPSTPGPTSRRDFREVPNPVARAAQSP